MLTNFSKTSSLMARYRQTPILKGGGCSRKGSTPSTPSVCAVRRAATLAIDLATMFEEGALSVRAGQPAHTAATLRAVSDEVYRPTHPGSFRRNPEGAEPAARLRFQVQVAASTLTMFFRRWARSPARRDHRDRNPSAPFRPADRATKDGGRHGRACSPL